MFYFVLGINNSGSTVVSQYLAAQAGAYLPPYGYNEGQHVPTVKSIFRTQPWKEDKEIDWGYVRSEWEGLMRADGKEIFVEGSPPNIMRVAQIKAAFADGHKAALLVCSPYMQIASCIKNYGKPPMSAALIDRFCNRWIRKARFQHRNRRQFPDLPLITYEGFCVEPQVVNQAFGVPFREGLKGVTGKVGLRALNMQQRTMRIRDLSTRTMAFLTPKEVDVVSERLSAAREVVEGLGYQVTDRAAFERRLTGDPDQAEEGRQSRAVWETRVT